MTDTDLKREVNEELEGNTCRWDSTLGRWIEPDETVEEHGQNTTKGKNEMNTSKELLASVMFGQVKAKEPKTDQTLHDAIVPILAEYSTKRFLEQSAIVLREMADEIQAKDKEGAFLYRADADEIETLSERVKW